ncbi:MAG: rRNA maturation RNase YbeY [Gemmataceae bacterium]
MANDKRFRISIADQQNRLRVDRRWLRQLVQSVLQREKVARAAIGIALVDNAIIAQLNQRYLGHRGPTDVLAFPMSDPGQPLAGEIVVSTEMAQEYACRYGHSPLDETGLYVIHGLLHLCGYDDRRSEDRRRMQRRQLWHARFLGLRLRWQPIRRQ